MSEAQDELRKQLGQTSKVRMVGQQAVQFSKLLDEQSIAAGAVKDPLTGLSINERQLDSDGIYYLAERFRTGNEAVKIAVLKKLSTSQRGAAKIHELERGWKIEEQEDGTFKHVDEHVGESWTETKPDGTKVKHESTGGIVKRDGTRTKIGVGLGETTTQNVDPEFKHIHDMGTKNAKGMDFVKPIGAAAKDVSPAEVATLSVHEMRRQLEYHYTRMSDTSLTAQQRADAEADAAQFFDGFRKALASPTLSGRMQPDAIDLVAQAGKKGAGHFIQDGAGNVIGTFIDKATAEQAQARALQLRPVPLPTTPPPPATPPPPPTPPPTPTTGP
jgi:hypothetical protein